MRYGYLETYYYCSFSLRLSSNVDVKGYGLGINFAERINLNEWVHVKIEQTAENRKYMFRIYQDHQQIFEVENKNAENFRNVKVYFGNPWHNNQEGFLRKLHILNSATLRGKIKFIKS